MSQDQHIDIEATTEPRIVAEDGTHVVIAIRVSKSWLAQNMHLLPALAELASRPEAELLA